ncbi:MAG: TonB-dependent receptor [Parvularculaceae bacterium]
MKKYLKNEFFGAASVGAIALSLGVSPALAQDEAASQGGLDQIVVTATYREQGLQDTSIAIDAIASDELVEKGISSAYDLTSIVPALTIIEGGGIQSQIFVRGIGNASGNTFVDPAITINYDGVAMAQGNSTSLAAFYDLERVEVLKGPQGTLYGKNATGGVINIIPAKPKLGEVEAIANFGYGNYNAVHVDGAVNLPIGENAAFRVAGSIVNRDGYLNSGGNEDDRKSVRGQFLFEPSDVFSIRLAGDYTSLGGKGGEATPIGSYQRAGLGNFIFNRNTLPVNEGGDTDVANAFRQSVLGEPGFGFYIPIQDEWFIDAELYGFNADIKLDAGFGEITIIPAWRHVDQESRFGHPGFNSGWWQTEADQYSVEARLAGDFGKFADYIVGGWFLHEDQSGNNTFNQEFVLPLQDYTQKTTSWALFGETTLNLSDSIRLIGGLRYTNDNKDLNGGIDNFITFCGEVGPLGGPVTPPASFMQGCAAPGNLPHWPTLDTPEETYAFLENNGWVTDPYNTRQLFPFGYRIPLDNGVGAILHGISPTVSSYSNDAISYRIVLEADLTDDSLVYASFNKGYRSGGLEPATAASYDPELLNAWTIGMKNTLFDNSVQLNLELFWWDYTDQQISYFNLNPNGVLQNTTQNVGSSTNRGVEADLLWLVTENTMFNATVQYLDASYDELHFFTTVPRDNINCPYTIFGANGAGDPLLDFDCSGSTSIYSPKWTIQAGLEQTFPLNNGLNLVGSVNTTWVDDQLTGFQNLPHETIPSHTRTDVSLALEQQDGKWYIRGWARNLEDKNRVRASQSPLLGMANVQVGIDLTYGVDIGMRF